MLSTTGTKQLTSEYEAAKAQLEDNDTYTQVRMCVYSIIQERKIIKKGHVKIPIVEPPEQTL